MPGLHQPAIGSLEVLVSETGPDWPIAVVCGALCVCLFLWVGARFGRVRWGWRCRPSFHSDEGQSALGSLIGMPLLDGLIEAPLITAFSL